MRSDLALAALASAAVPGMKPVAVAGIALSPHERADDQRAVVEDATGRRWLIRSPLSPVAGARLLRNDELVRQLSRHLPFKVPAPVGRAEVGRDGYAVVYPHVEGLPLDFTHLPAGPGLASAVGRALAAVHNIPLGVFEQQDVPTFDAAGWRQRIIATVDRAAETGRVPTGLLARWEQAFDAPALWGFATTPVHGAFRGATVLVAFADDEADSGRVVAVTDWEEAMVADPAVDLADLFTRTSPAAWESVLDSYVLARAQRPDPYLHARARLVAETNRLTGLAQAVTDGDDELVRHTVEALRRMDRLTEDADPLVPATAREVGTAGGAAAWTAHAETSGDAGEDTAAPAQTGAGQRAPEDGLPKGLREDDLPEDARPDQERSSPAHAGDVEDLVVSDDDVTAEVPVLPAAQDGAELDDGSAPRAEPAARDKPTTPEESAPSDELDDEERLHELYGMPGPPREDG